MVSLSNPTTTIIATGSSPQEREALWGPKLRDLIIGEDPMTWDINVSTMFPGGLITDDHPDYHDTILVDYQPVDNEEAAGGGESAVVSGPELVEAANGVKKRKKKKGRGLVEVERQGSEVGSNDVSCGAIPLAKPAVVPSPTKGLPWTEQEHRMFLLGLQQHRKGDWKTIARNFVPTRSATQVASHAQKFYNRHKQWKQHRRPSIHDITSIHDPSPFIKRRVSNTTMATPTLPNPTLDFCVSDNNIDANMYPVRRQQEGFMDNNSFQPEMTMMMMMMMMMMMQPEMVVQPQENLDYSFLQTQQQPEMLYNVADDDGACGGFPDANNVNDIDPYTCSCPYLYIDPYTYQPQ